MKIPLKQYIVLLEKYLKPQLPRLALLMFLLFSSIGLQLVNPQIVRSFIDGAREGLAAQNLFRLAVLFISLALLQQIVSVSATYFSEKVGWTATNALRGDLTEHCLDLDMSFHNKHTPGEMIERLDGDVTALSNFFSQFVIHISGNILLMMGILVLLFVEDWRVGLSLALFSVTGLFILIRLRNIAVPHWKASREAHADLYGFLEERLSGTEDIRASGGKPYVMRRFFNLLRDLMKKEIKAGLMVNVMVNSGEVTFAIGTAVAFAVGAYVFRSGLISIGTVYLIFHYTTMLVFPMRRISFQLQNLQKAGAGIIRIEELFQTETRINDGESAVLSSGALSVKFSKVSFSYDSGEWSLKNLSFNLEKGRILGLLGRTGSGKTTIGRLLFRLYDIDGGAIYLDGTDIRRTALGGLRRSVGIVTQNVQLFQASLRNNITFFNSDIADDRIFEVFDQLGLMQWYRSLSDGLETEITGGGGGLSTGEAQLLAFTRIFLRDPGLVILDEASSRLDPATEQLIEHAVGRLLCNRTGIVIAHRLATVQRADEIMIIDNGEIKEYGDREKLLRDTDSQFSRLLRQGLEEVLA
jgi:ABC-type multidrug transport system fused ATPase/permease subunit